MLAVTQVVFSLNNSATLFPSSESNNCLFTDGLKHHSNIRGSIQRTQASKPPTSALLCHFYQHQKASKEESVPLGHSKSHWRFEMSATSEPAPRGYASSPAPHTSPRSALAQEPEPRARPPDSAVTPAPPAQRERFVRDVEHLCPIPSSTSREGLECASPTCQTGAYGEHPAFKKKNTNYQVGASAN